MLSRLWRSIRYGIAAKFYLLTAIALAALVVLAAASIHFASQTRTAAERLYGEGVVGIQTVTELEVLFEQHRALITAAPALLDRSRIRDSRLAVAALNARIEESVQTQLSRSDATREILLQQIAAHVPRLSQAGDRVLMLAHNFAQEQALAVSEGEYAQAANVIQGAMEGRYQEQIRHVDREVHRLSKASSGLMLWVVAIRIGRLRADRSGHLMGQASHPQPARQDHRGHAPAVQQRTRRRCALYESPR